MRGGIESRSTCDPAGVIQPTATVSYLLRLIKRSGWGFTVNHDRRSALVLALAAGLVVEGLLVLVAGGVLLAELVAARETSGADAVALLVIAALALLGSALMVTGLLRGRFWVRAAIVVWQLLQLVVGISALTGPGAQPVLGWPLIALAAILMVLLFTPGVQAWTARREQG